MGGASKSSSKDFAHVDPVELASEREETRRHHATAGTLERGPAPVRRSRPRPRLAAGYVHATNPDGVDVVFVPGEALPDWVQLPAAQPERL